ncbi:MAG: hypothetical protein CL731_07005 [Chloroflexi bacterium]|mgnify:CR=1 FL=1|nr:hypothetical protein [Chloroflexota bacterium]
MNILTTIMSKPVNGKQAAAVNQFQELAQTARDAGANRVNVSRVISGQNIGQLQCRVFTDDLAHAGKISAAMWSSDTATLSMSEEHPSGEIVGLIRSSVIYRALPTPEADPVMGTVLGLQPHPGNGPQLEERLAAWADLWVEGGAMQSFVTSAITGTNGPALFLTVTYADWDSWGAAVSHTRGSELMRSLRESSNSAATVMANIQLATL